MWCQQRSKILCTIMRRSVRVSSFDTDLLKLLTLRLRCIFLYHTTVGSYILELPSLILTSLFYVEDVMKTKSLATIQSHFLSYFNCWSFCHLNLHVAPSVTRCLHVTK